MERENKLIIIPVVVLFFTVLANAYAHDFHYHENTTVQQVSVNQCSNIAIAAASGQHNYKAGNFLQWSGAGSYFDGACDSSAVSIGLAKQMGKVFSAVNYSSDGSNSMISFSFSGTF